MIGKWKKVLLSSILCCSVFSFTTMIKAEENTTSTSDVLQPSDIEISNVYSDEIKKDEVTKIYYQQGTGLSTIDLTLITVDEIDTKIGSHILNDNLSVSVVDNPATDKTFLQTPQEFEIVLKVTLNKEGNISEAEIKVPAEVVKIEGKVLDKSIEYENLYYAYNADKETTDSIFDFMKNYYSKPYGYANYTYNVQLNDGTIKQETAICRNKGAFIAANGGFSMATCYYDLKYTLDFSAINADTTLYDADKERCLTQPIMYKYLNAYIIDKDNNVTRGPNIIIPASSRKDVTFNSEIKNVSLNAKEGNLPAGTVLKGVQITNLDLKQPYIAYDFNVYNGESKVQPAGIVNISISISKELKNKDIKVYYLDKNGKYNEVSSKVTGDNITFSTDHFSTYVVTEEINKSVSAKPNSPEKDTQVNDNTSKPQTVDKSNQSIKQNKANAEIESVNTGDTTTTTAYLALLGISILVLGGATLKKYKNSSAEN